MPGSCFRFPSDEVRKRKNHWKKAVSRDYPINTNNAGVCILHFQRKFIITHNERGVPLAKPMLTKNALPSTFSYLFLKM